jgi:hypothetical protein
MKKTTYYLSKQSSCFAILINEEIKAGDFMADKNGIYECPEIDGFIGPYRVWFKNDNYPGLAMSRAFGDKIGAKVGKIIKNIYSF